MLPDASHYFAPMMIALSAVAIVYGGFLALVQRDIKKLIAYSSVSHMGFITLGLFTFDAMGLRDTATLPLTIEDFLFDGLQIICARFVVHILHHSLFLVVFHSYTAKTLVKNQFFWTSFKGVTVTLLYY